MAKSYSDTRQLLIFAFAGLAVLPATCGVSKAADLRCVSSTYDTRQMASCKKLPQPSSMPLPAKREEHPTRMPSHPSRLEKLRDIGVFGIPSHPRDLSK
jgi:hypothetical protein